jgi:hypothetical protein
MTKRPILAWHFVGDKLRDGSPIPADGVTLHHTDPLVLCESGLHASVKAYDALKYAPGHMLCRVRCSGQVLKSDDKLVCSERTIVWRADATVMMRLFARQCALDVAHLWDMPDVVRQYLETGDETLRDAAWTATSGVAAQAAASGREAAWDAARAAAWAAARDAAWAAADAAWAAAQAAAAARAAARSGAQAAARAATAARAVEWTAARDAAWTAARDAAWAASWTAARDAQSKRFEAMAKEIKP